MPMPDKADKRHNYNKNTRLSDYLHNADEFIDGHNDFAWMIRGWLQNRIDTTTTNVLRNMPIGQTDLQRLKAGRLGCQFWSAYVPE